MKKQQKTFMQRKEDVTREWHLVDIKDQVLGRVATQIAEKLMGKNKATYTPHTDGGDYVVVINADKVAVTGDKENKKVYYWHTLFPGGLKERTFQEMMDKHPEEIIRRAVKNMLPKNRTRNERMARLKIYVGEDHPHKSQLGGK